MPPLRRLDTAGDSVRQVIRAYHGSPYDFDRFDASKIGTGEGLQAFSHGLYFAQRRPVAEGSQWWPQGNQILVDDEPVARNFQLVGSAGNLPQALQSSIRMGFVTPREALAIMRGKQWDVGTTADDLRYMLQSAKDEDVRSGAKSLLHRMDVVPKGHVYEVEIGHPESSLLDWDSAVGDQSAQIARAVENLGGHGMRSLTGMQAYRRIGETLGDRMPTPSVVDSPQAAQAMLSEGVPGVRYFDGSSRREGAGTRNYVIFPGAEDQIRILRKYGLMAPIAAGAIDDSEQ